MVGAIIAGASAVGSAIAGGVQARKERKRQKEILEYNKQVNRRQYQTQLLTNSPSFKMAQLKSAGLNPNVVSLDQLAPSAIDGGGSAVASPPVSADYSSLAAGGANVASAMQQKKELDLKKEAFELEKQEKEATIKRIEQSLKVSPTALANLVKSAGGTLDLYPQGRASSVVLEDGNLNAYVPISYDNRELGQNADIVNRNGKICYKMNASDFLQTDVGSFEINSYLRVQDAENNLQNVAREIISKELGNALDSATLESNISKAYSESEASKSKVLISQHEAEFLGRSLNTRLSKLMTEKRYLESQMLTAVYARENMDINTKSVAIRNAMEEVNNAVRFSGLDANNPAHTKAVYEILNGMATDKTLQFTKEEQEQISNLATLCRKNEISKEEFAEEWQTSLLYINLFYSAVNAVDKTISTARNGRQFVVDDNLKLINEGLNLLPIVKAVK